MAFGKIVEQVDFMGCLGFYYGGRWTPFLFILYFDWLDEKIWKKCFIIEKPTFAAIIAIFSIKNASHAVSTSATKNSKI